MKNDRTKWGKADWQAYALAVEAAHQAALDGWGVTVAELENHSNLLHQQVEQINRLQSQSASLSLALMTVLDLKENEPTGLSEGRKPGRPRKDKNAAMLLALVEGEKPAFLAANPNLRASDPAVLSWFFENEYRKHGLRAQRVNTAEFKKKLKTMCNVISDARVEAKKQERRKLPENT